MPKINNNTGITSSAYCTVLNNQSRQQQQNIQQPLTVFFFKNRLTICLMILSEAAASGSNPSSICSYSEDITMEYYKERIEKRAAIVKC